MISEKETRDLGVEEEKVSESGVRVVTVYRGLGGCEGHWEGGRMGGRERSRFLGLSGSPKSMSAFRSGFHVFHLN